MTERLTGDETRELLRRGLEDPLIGKVLELIDVDGTECDTLRDTLERIEQMHCGGYVMSAGGYVNGCGANRVARETLRGVSV